MIGIAQESMPSVYQINYLAKAAFVIIVRQWSLFEKVSLGMASLNNSPSRDSTESSLNTTVLLIGTGISGLFTALKLAEADIDVLLMTKSGLSETNSRYAQGGIATVLPQNPDDSLDLHVRDTMNAGAGLSDDTVVRSILSEGYEAVEDLLVYGVPFDRDANNQLALTREAAHSVNRIIHAGGDATGASVEMTLIGKVRSHPKIKVYEYCQAIALLTKSNRCYGCRAIQLKENRDILIQARYTVLATGGIGRLYSNTTNPPIATGDGLSLAHKATAKLQDLEFIQFHPTAFYADGQLRFLISEALRGEGGILKNANGDLFAKKYHPDGELATRDIVTRAIFAEMRISDKPCVYLDISHMPAAKIEKRFPTILQNCLEYGIDIRKEQIPVAPAAHYIMGGVAVDTQGHTSLEHLFAVGEVACTRLHGANRLASNSLLECVVLARRVAHAISNLQKTLPPASKADQWVESFEKQYRFDTDSDIALRLDQLHQLMWDLVGIVRSEKGLQVADQQIEAMIKEARSRTWSNMAPEGLEYLSQLNVASLITKAALKRKDSLGAHYRLDSPVKQLHSQLIDEIDFTPELLVQLTQ